MKHCERISRLQNLANVDIPTETGAVKTTSPSELPRRKLESIHIERDFSLCFHQLVGENGKPMVFFRYEKDQKTHESQ